MAQPVNRGALLRMHQGTMPGQPQAQPGRYHPPAPAMVPSLLDELFQFISRPQCDNPVIVAAWAHSRFESIHPGAVGAGRTGPPYRCATASGSAV